MKQDLEHSEYSQSTHVAAAEHSQQLCNTVASVIPTYKTKLKLDREVGGGDLSELCTITYLITYPYGWTVNFEIWNLRFKHRGTKYGMLLTTHQPPITKASQTSAWSYKYIGDWMGKTEGSPIGFGAIFGRLKSWTIPLAKVVDFEPLGALFALGGLEADLTPIWRSH